MLTSILKRYPELTSDKVMLVDRGKGVEIAKWDSDKPQPTLEEMNGWVEEDSLTPHLTPIEQLQKDQAELMMQLVMKGVL
jgi:hypothetical protein